MSGLLRRSWLLTWWVEQILGSYVSRTAPDGMMPILYLDSYLCQPHDGFSQNQNSGLTRCRGREHTTRCNGLYQPVDVGINKLLKNPIQGKQWEAWTIEEGLASGTTLPPLREDISIILSNGGPKCFGNETRRTLPGVWSKAHKLRVKNEFLSTSAAM